MSDTNVVYLSQYRNDVAVDQAVRVTDRIPDDVPESIQLVHDIGTYLFDERDLMVKKDGPTLFIKSGENEYALTIRPLDSHWENLTLWANHVAEKYQRGLAEAKPDEPIDLTVEEILILNEEFGEPEESGGT